MANPQRIGLHLTDDNIVLTESSSKKQYKIISSPITTSLVSSADAPVVSDISEEIHIVSTFQRLLRENKIEPGSVAVSIPIKDVFLRSFVLPWMPASDLQSVVFYEAKKYVPFDLKLLDYVYQAVPFYENKQKRLRIIFYAVRKQTIEKYERILKQVGCKAIVYESSLFSLARYLLSKNLLKSEQKTVVIYMHKDYGQIIFYEKGVCNFVREFSLSVPEVHDPNAISDVLRAQLIREVRKSLGYYNRQFSQDKIKDVLLLSVATDQELMKLLSEEMSVKVRAAEASVTSGLQTSVGIDVMCGTGAAMTNAPSWFATFNFLTAKVVAKPQSAFIKSLPGNFSQLLSWEIADFVYAIQAAAVCIVLLLAGFFYGRNNLQTLQDQSQSLTLQQGELADKTVDDIMAIIKRNNKQLEMYEAVFKEKSRMAPMLVDLTKAMPEGSWLEDMNVRYAAGGFSMDFKGYVYSSSGAQFKAVNDFLARLKANRYLASVKFKLNTLQKKTLNGHEVVYFSIVGS